MLWQWVRALVTVLIWIIAGGAFAGEGGSDGVTYVELSPSFVTNYGGQTTPPRFVKVDVALRVSKIDIADAVKYHSAALRNYLLLLFTAQTDQTMSTPQGRENLRRMALQGVNQLLRKEEGADVQVQDLLFTTFVVQQ